MKIEFKDRSVIECKMSDNTNNIIVIIQAKDSNNNLKKITNICELTIEEFKLLISDLKY